LIGVIGGGQLGRMLGLAGIALGHEFRFLEPSPHPPAAAVGDVVAIEYDDPTAVDAFVEGCEVVTYEFENVPVDAARRIATRVPVWPPPAALAAAQDRLTEKELFRRAGVPTPQFVPVDSSDELASALSAIGDAVVKTRREGYDGKGQTTAARDDDADPIWNRLGEVPLLVEERVPFERELSLLAVRGRDGATTFYPLVENVHRDGILRVSYAPAGGASSGLQVDAERYGKALLDELAYVGVLAIEFFQRNGGLLANEIAPRVHNSGHWTIDGAICSQFENHLRAVLGLPLGPASTIGDSVMVNFIGSVPDLRALLQVPRAHVHLYSKAARPGRKLGHVTLVDADTSAVETVLALAGAGSFLPRAPGTWS
jgi:5-(carboxyamino)imidazole ribonucleotide synthase